MSGKYSPTVNAAYSKNQNWFEKYSIDTFYDNEGYDSYGYNKNELDRAGYKEDDYWNNENLYLCVDLDWGFDGNKPVNLKNYLFSN